MTREDAIKALEIELNQWNADCKSYHAVKEAPPMAIDALRNEDAVIDRVIAIVEEYDLYKSDEDGDLVACRSEILGEIAALKEGE